jgi:hypothetical protein
MASVAVRKSAAAEQSAADVGAADVGTAELAADAAVGVVAGGLDVPLEQAEIPVNPMPAATNRTTVGDDRRES